MSRKPASQCLTLVLFKHRDLPRRPLVQLCPGRSPHPLLERHQRARDGQTDRAKGLGKTLEPRQESVPGKDSNIHVCAGLMEDFPRALLGPESGAGVFCCCTLQRYLYAHIVSIFIHPVLCVVYCSWWSVFVRLRLPTPPLSFCFPVPCLFLVNTCGLSQKKSSRELPN